eukprot:223959-Chlamydomonas_euryale.AAC.1
MCGHGAPAQCHSGHPLAAATAAATIVTVSAAAAKACSGIGRVSRLVCTLLFPNSPRPALLHARPTCTRCLYGQPACSAMLPHQQARLPPTTACSYSAVLTNQQACLPPPLPYAPALPCRLAGSASCHPACLP